jgi:hypothetical protein
LTILKTFQLFAGPRFGCPTIVPNSVPTIGRLSAKSAAMPKVDFREEVVNVALAELLEQRGLSEGR